VLTNEYDSNDVIVVKPKLGLDYGYGNCFVSICYQISTILWWIKIFIIKVNNSVNTRIIENMINCRMFTVDEYCLLADLWALELLTSTTSSLLHYCSKPTCLGLQPVTGHILSMSVTSRRKAGDKFQSFSQTSIRDYLSQTWSQKWSTTR